MRFRPALLVSAMNRTLLLVSFVAALAFSAMAQEKPVAVINGETITAAKLDQLYDRIGAQMREQYEKAGGKAAFLENYLRKRLVIQEAIKSGFDKRTDVQADMEAAKESALFDRYVRDVVSANIVTESMIRQYYDQHRNEFATPEKIHVRHIVVTVTNVGPAPKTQEQALDRMKTIAATLHAEDGATVTRLRLARFARLARQYSEDPSAESGGDLGWVARGQLDPDFETAAFALPVGTPSGIVETKFGYHLILVEEKKPAGTEPYEEARPNLREFLMRQHAADVMQSLTKLTNELRASSKVAIYSENIK
jgi:peptidyl-prolyl cis-trans isomerase C